MTEEAKKIVEAIKEAFEVLSAMELPAEEQKIEITRDAAMTLIAQLEQVTRERDAAIRDFTEAMKYSENCMFCKYLSGTDDEIDCNKPKIMPCENCWQWRGVEVTNDAQKGSDAKS